MEDASGSFDGGLGNVGDEGIPNEWRDGKYTPIPRVYWIAFLGWTFLLIAWVFNNYYKTGRQISNLQRVITMVPCIKFPVLALSFGFWFTCTNGVACNTWIAFGILCFRVFLEVGYFVTFLLIAQGWCITRESLTKRETRSIASVIGVLYLALAGFNIWTEFFLLVVVVTYCVMVGMVFFNIQGNIKSLRRQLDQVRRDNVQALAGPTYLKYVMFLRFRETMAIFAISEALIHTLLTFRVEAVWVRVAAHEAMEFVVFGLVMANFRARSVANSPLFDVIPGTRAVEVRELPPIHEAEVDTERFLEEAAWGEWVIGIPDEGQERRDPAPSSENGEKEMVLVCFPGAPLLPPPAAAEGAGGAPPSGPAPSPATLQSHPLASEAGEGGEGEGAGAGAGGGSRGVGDGAGASTSAPAPREGDDGPGAGAVHLMDLARVLGWSPGWSGHGPPPTAVELPVVVDVVGALGGGGGGADAGGQRDGVAPGAPGGASPELPGTATPSDVSDEGPAGH